MLKNGVAATSIPVESFEGYQIINTERSSTVMP